MWTRKQLNTYCRNVPNTADNRKLMEQALHEALQGERKGKEEVSKEQ